MADEIPVASDLSEAQELARQAEVELGILLSIEQSLRMALQWMMRGRGNTHKLSTLRFHTWSFERHLTRMQVLADHGGYLHWITDNSPRLANHVATLKSERAILHDRLEKIILQLERVSHHDTKDFRLICVDLEALLNELHEHGRSESEMLQRSFTQEVGGSG